MGQLDLAKMIIAVSFARLETAKNLIFDPLKVFFKTAVDKSSFGGQLKSFAGRAERILAIYLARLETAKKTNFWAEQSLFKAAGSP